MHDTGSSHFAGGTLGAAPAHGGSEHLLPSGIVQASTPAPAHPGSVTGTSGGLQPFVAAVAPHAAHDTTPVAAEVATPDTAAPAHGGQVEDAIASVRASATMLQVAISTLSQQLGGHGDGVAGPVGPLHAIDAQVADVLDHLGTIHDDAAAHLDQIAGVAGHLLDGLTSAGAAAPLLDAGTALASGTLGDLQDVIADTASTAAATATDVLDTVGHTAGHVVSAATQPLTHDGALSSATDLLHSATIAASGALPVTEAVDHLDGVLGGDPAGGITTLVGMVAAADHFDLQQAPAGDALVAATGALGQSDLLADVAPASVLLGQHDDHHDGVSALTDHLHDGLFGHG